MPGFARKNKRNGGDTGNTATVEREETQEPTSEVPAQTTTEDTNVQPSTEDTNVQPSTEDSGEASTVDVATESVPEADITEEKKIVRVKVEDLGEVSAIVADDDAPPVIRARSRQNPYDDAVKQSYDQRFWEKTEEKPKGRWAKQEVGNVYAATRLIRSAAMFHNVGVEIRSVLLDDNTPKGPGTIWFRGKPKKGADSQD